MPRMRGALVQARNHQALLQTLVKILSVQWTRALETRSLVSLHLWTGGRLVGSVNGPWHPGGVKDFKDFILRFQNTLLVSPSLEPDPSSSRQLYNHTSINAKARRRFS